VPSELALTVAEQVLDRGFPQAAVRDLQRLLRHTLSKPDPAAYRWNMLNPLATLIRERRGALPTAREYDLARQERFADAPAASTLAHRYGTWLKALHAAARLMQLSKVTPVWTQQQAPHTIYTPTDCAAALAQFRKLFGDWPYPAEYREWSDVARKTSRRCASIDPRLPGINLIYKRFGTFANAVDYAKAIYH
jgi:hypothetical protein